MTTTLAAKIAAASKEVGGKLRADSRNQEQKYDYISADKILAVCGQALAEQGIVIFPSIVYEHVDMTDRGQGKARYDAEVKFCFVVADGGDKIELPWVGRGSDYSVPDKATYKAITSGHKYFIAKLLNVGEGNEDGEHEAPESPPTPQRTAPAQKAPQSAPQGHLQGNGMTTTARINGEVHEVPFPNAPTQEELELLNAWGGVPTKAKTWAIEQGACDNEFHAKESMKKIVDRDFDGRFHTGNANAVLLAFMRRQREKLAQLAELEEPEAA